MKLTKYEYSILEFLFYCRVDFSFFMRDNLEEKANLILPETKKELMTLLNRLKNLNMIVVKDIYGENRVNDIVNMKKGIYSVEISNKAGDIIAKNKKVFWDRYCNYSAIHLDSEYLMVKIELHKNKVNKMLKILDADGIKYKVYNLKYWYPLYWKRLKNARTIEVM